MKTWDFLYDEDNAKWIMSVSDGTCFIGDTKGECIAQFFDQN